MINILLIVGKKDGSDIIYTKDHEILVQSSSCSPKHVVFELGKYFYRPADATMKLTRGKCGISKKVPYLIEMNHLLLFPTMGIERKECCWVNYYCVDDFYKIKNGTELSFRDYSFLKSVNLDFKFNLPVEKRIIMEQMKRCKFIHESYLMGKKELNIESIAQ